MVFSIRVADTIIQIESVYEMIYWQSERYLSKSEPECCITVSRADIETERANSDGKRSDAYFETLAVYRKLAEQLLSEKIFLFHGSVIAMDGKAFLFTAKSGTGKSTHAALWRQVYGDKVTMVNDDKPLLKVEEDRVLACGTPWDGKHRLSNPINVPMRAICILERGEENEIHEISYAEAYPMLVQQSYRPRDAKRMGEVLSLIDQLEGKMKFYRMHCNMDPEAARVAFEAMSK